MEEKGFHQHEVFKVGDQLKEGGFHFERDLQMGRKMEIITNDGRYEAEAREDGIYMKGDSPLSDEFELARIFGIPERKEDSFERMEPNYIKVDDTIEILLVNRNQEIKIGPVKGFKLIPEANN
jgi:hypothetical protein